MTRERLQITLYNPLTLPTFLIKTNSLEVFYTAAVIAFVVWLISGEKRMATMSYLCFEMTRLTVFLHSRI